MREFSARVWNQPVTALFLIDASSGQLPMPSVQALLAMEYRPIPLSGSPGDKAVDIGIQRMLKAIGERHGDVLLASHDGDFVDDIASLLGQGRKVGVSGSAVVERPLRGAGRRRPADPRPRG